MEQRGGRWGGAAEGPDLDSGGECMEPAAPPSGGLGESPRGPEDGGWCNTSHESINARCYSYLDPDSKNLRAELLSGASVKGRVI